MTASRPREEQAASHLGSFAVRSLRLACDMALKLRKGYLCTMQHYSKAERKAEDREQERGGEGDGYARTRELSKREKQRFGGRSLGDGRKVEPIGVASLLGEPATVEERVLEEGADETMRSFDRDFGAIVFVMCQPYTAGAA